MNHLPATETRLLGLTPRQYQLHVDRARQEAARLHAEAVGAAIGSVARWLGRLVAGLRPGAAPARPPVPARTSAAPAARC